MCTLCGGVDAKTLRKWAWAYIDALADLEPEVVSTNCCCVSVIAAAVAHCCARSFGTMGSKATAELIAQFPATVLILRFQIKDQHSRATSSRRRVDFGTRYVFVFKPVVWINGPYPCGRYPDISIFRDCLMTELGDAERVETDDGYIGEAPLHCKCPKSFVNPEETEFMQQRVRNRQETINKRLKDWGVLRNMFRHVDKLSEHGSVVRALLVLTQLAINRGERLFECGYKNPPFEEHNDNRRNTGFQRRHNNN